MTSQTRSIAVGNKRLGPGEPVFVVAEIGINHNGDMDLCRAMIDAAARTGADAVKFQNYQTEDFLSDRALTYEYVSAGKKVSESQFDMFKRCELTRDQLASIKRHCDDAGVICFSTPTSERGVLDCVELGMPLLKNGSDYLVNTPLVEAMARTGVPTVLSTGMATLAEIDDATRAFRSAGGRELVLLHCVSAYPTPDDDVHLRKIPALRDAFDVAVGLSDHTHGNVAALGAVALGACFIEKHFTTDRNLPGPDHSFSSTPAEMKELVDNVRRLEKQLAGSAAIGPTASEARGRQEYRLSCVARDDLAAGRVLSAADVAFRRPAHGLAPKDAGLLVGRKLRGAVKRGHVFAVQDLE